jgi:hypothetical protein
MVGMVVADLARLQQIKLKQIPDIDVLEEVTRVLGVFQITEGGAGRRQAGSAGPAPVLSLAQVHSREMAEAGTESAAGIRVPLSQCFVRRVELPAATRSDVRQILNFDLECATPFRPKEVHTAHVVEGDAGAKGYLIEYRVAHMRPFAVRHHGNLRSKADLRLGNNSPGAPFTIM